MFCPMGPVWNTLTGKNWYEENDISCSGNKQIVINILFVVWLLGGEKKSVNQNLSWMRYLDILHLPLHLLLVRGQQ